MIELAITDKQIMALRHEARAAGDGRQADICDIALDVHETADSQGGDLVVRDGQHMTRSEARAECERVINDAAAQVDDP